LRLRSSAAISLPMVPVAPAMTTKGAAVDMMVVWNR
jgi:hypothetical protein